MCMPIECKDEIEVDAVSLRSNPPFDRFKQTLVCYNLLYLHFTTG